MSVDVGWWCQFMVSVDWMDGWIVFIVPEGQFGLQTAVNTTSRHYKITITWNKARRKDISIHITNMCHQVAIRHTNTMSLLVPVKMYVWLSVGLQLVEKPNSSRNKGSQVSVCFSPPSKSTPRPWCQETHLCMERVLSVCLNCLCPLSGSNLIHLVQVIEVCANSLLAKLNKLPCLFLLTVLRLPNQQ